MKKLSLLICLSIIFFQACNSEQSSEQPTEIIVIGTLHNPEPNFNPDTLFNILEQVKPDFILRELDSSFFTADFKHKNPPKQNEGIASQRYIEKYPSAQLRPYEFEGRNAYRINHGMRPTDRLTTRLVDSLYQADLLTPQEAEIFKTYQDLLEPLKVAAAKSPDNFNNAKNDSICERRQYYQYQMVTKITNNRPEFANRFHTKPDGEDISYRDGYQLWADFWDTRNQTMARNILRIAEMNEGKRLVVLTGFMHRYYILKELKKSITDKKIVIKEFYDY
ncbi:hypothetical protein E1176_12100 [Fulvivirga sp. RKSG066]|uniref:hypothetical protein n=1 Tax=Fulvivirga aurantia TaxID=2529383 RepID=UPI0012BBF555|nr:hypothetical protein [Fulvivirga aurantia]MTI21764.1 hypothetical protein [Fulvivirga aurantia]